MECSSASVLYDVGYGVGWVPNHGLRVCLCDAFTNPIANEHAVEFAIKYADAIGFSVRYADGQRDDFGYTFANAVAVAVLQRRARL